MSDTPSISVIGGQGAKRQKVRMVPVAVSLLEIDEDLLRTIAGYAVDLRLICPPDHGGAPLLDVCFHKALTYLLEIRTHCDAPLWAHVDPDVDRADLKEWDGINVDPSVV